MKSIKRRQWFAQAFQRGIPLFISATGALQSTNAALAQMMQLSAHEQAEPLTDTPETSKSAHLAALSSTFLASWRSPRKDSDHYLGLIHADWQAERCQILERVKLNGRPHGLDQLADGSVIAMGLRPGRWLMHWRGSSERYINADDGFAFNGHAAICADRSVIYTTETSVHDQRGYLAVRDARRFEVLERWPTNGIEPHHVLLDRHGRLWIAHGGIRRGAMDQKLDLASMQSKLSCMDAQSGAVIGEWSLADRRLSMRHLALSEVAHTASSPHQVLIGIAMQAEHDSLETRRLAPSLAIFRDDRLDVISTGTDALGYGADISAAPDGGFCVSSNRARKMLWWRPNSDQSLSIIATIEEPYALCKDAKSTNVYLACTWGVARWQPKQAQLLPWPEPMVLDNHWSLMSTTPNA